MSGFRMFLGHPVLGVGVDNFRVVFSHYRVEEAVHPAIFQPAAHNTYIEILSGTGLVGFIPFMLIIVLSIANFHNASRRLRLLDQGKLWTIIEGIKWGYVAFLINLFFLSWQHSVLLWLFLALSIIVNRISQKTFTTDGR